MINFIVGCVIGVVLCGAVKAACGWRMPARVRVVRMPEGKYAVRKGYFPPYLFLDKDGRSWWRTAANVRQYCLISLEEARELAKYSNHNGTPV